MKQFIRNIRAKFVKGLAVIGIIVGAAVSADAQVDTQVLLDSSGVIPIGLSNVVTFTAVKGSAATFQMNTKLTGAGTAGVFLNLEASNDGTVYSPSPVNFWRAANGATAVSHLTNFTLVAPFYRATIHNTNSVAVTNSTITVVIKNDYR